MNKNKRYKPGRLTEPAAPEKRPEDYGYVRVNGDLILIHAEGLTTEQTRFLAVNCKKLMALMLAPATDKDKAIDNIINDAISAKTDKI